ncbi:MAG: VOC family protein [Asticcacaulis sp.]|nr:VOC family protein [Asticcacaulis sp.]
MPAILEQRPFLPAKDYERSIDFYSRLGWEVRFKSADLALMVQGPSMFFVQKAWVQDWAHNTMVHIVVEDAQAWFEAVSKVKAEGGFEEVVVKPPRHEDYGALATHVLDPAGVLLFFAQFVT